MAWFNIRTLRIRFWGWRAVQERASGSQPNDHSSSVPPATSLIIGPWRVMRTFTTTGSSWPATEISSWMVSISSHSPWYSYWLGFSGFTRSMNRSCTSGPRLVTPQAMWALWPIITPGAPGNEKPAELYGQSGPVGSQ